jgi:hypothetical protein
MDNLVKDFALFDHAHPGAGPFFYSVITVFQIVHLGCERLVPYLQAPGFVEQVLSGLFKVMDFGQAAVADPEAVLERHQQDNHEQGYKFHQVSV